MSEKQHNAEQQHEQQLAGGSTGKQLGGWLVHRAKPYTPPWIVTAGVGVAGAAGSLRWEHSAGAGVGLTLSSVALTAATWWAAKKTGPERRLHSAITVAAASAWITGASLAGPASGMLPDAFLMGGPVVAISWNVRQVMRRNPDAIQAAADGDGSLFEKVKLAGARIRKTEVEPNRVTAGLVLPAGEMTNDDVSRVLPNLASALDVAPTAVRYLPDPESARRGELVVVPRDMLAEVVEWEMPTGVGGSIADALVIGRYDDGSPLVLWLPGDPEIGRNSTHLLICGMTGSGKGDGALNVLTEILGRRDVIVWLSDPKSFQDFRPLLPAFDWAVEGGAPTETMVTALQAVIPARTRWLGAHGYRQWVPAAAEQQTNPGHSCQQGQACGCPGMPYLVSWFEEAAASIRFMGDDGFTEAAQLARAAGIAVVISLQRPSHDQLSTTTRASLPSALVFGVNDARDEGMALPAPVLDAGASPSAWGNRRPGYCYLVSPGVEEQRYSSPGRTFRFTGNAARVMEQLAVWSVRNGAKADPITAGAAAAAVGKAYTERAGSGPADQTPEDDTSVYETPEDATPTDRVDPEDVEIDPTAELSGVPDALAGLTFGPESTAADLTPEEARAAMVAIVDDFEQRGVMVIGPKDVMEFAAQFGRKRPWVSGEFRRLIEDGRLKPTSQGGRYRIVPSPALV
ncbi:plasmid transfer protein TraB [Kitasatospora sp. NBC_01287]|uniref:plasmid transfer protein TraB n=1 Tax=Kitasatospora sp. NBC_01287 TaxID=2903573 RepID=UPI00224CDB7B|nr:plasmid transfer protein TraB [Kitasatospora sp. NBC_01287]MCX4752011.1 plasmid transfer protein TraB [Kitasatospora sp. NBC_01287]